MTYREPFSFIPYKITLGKFYYGGSDFWSKVDLTHAFGIGTSPFQTENGEEFNPVIMKHMSEILIKLGEVEESEKYKQKSKDLKKKSKE